MRKSQRFHAIELTEENFKSRLTLCINNRGRVFICKRRILYYTLHINTFSVFLLSLTFVQCDEYSICTYEYTLLSGVRWTLAVHYVLIFCAIPNSSTVVEPVHSLTFCVHVFHGLSRPLLLSILLRKIDFCTAHMFLVSHNISKITFNCHIFTVVQSCSLYSM